MAEQFLPNRRAGAEYMPQLDSVRALAVLGVMLWHFWGAPFGVLGVLGVQLFFVLSGFLITSILLRERERFRAGIRSGWFVVRQFYVRRCLRIFPLFYATLAVCWATALTDAHEGLVWHATYASNFYFARVGDYASDLAHFWTLAVEEQFYLFWPFIVLFATRRLLLPILIATSAVAPLYRGIGAWAGVDSTGAWLWLFVPPFANCDSLAIGALLAYGSSAAPGARAVRTTLLKTAAWLAVPVALTFWIMSVLDIELHVWRMGFQNTAWALLFAWLIARAGQGLGGGVGRLLQLWPLRYIGRISYGLYLFHPFMERVARWTFAAVALPFPSNHVAVLILLSAASVAFASVSWVFYEAPLNGLKQRFAYEPPLRAGPRPTAD
jgi:peptidoglycan/LPS O-acetylase OafA/YrhL